MKRKHNKEPKKRWAVYDPEKDTWEFFSGDKAVTLTTPEYNRLVEVFGVAVDRYKAHEA